MTKEELEEKAKEYFNANKNKLCTTIHGVTYYVSATEDVITEVFKNAYEECEKDLLSRTDREQLEKENAELKQKLERNKEFAVIEAIEKLEQENAELKAEELAQCKAQRDSKFIIDKQAVEIEARNCQFEALATENRKTLEENAELKDKVQMWDFFAEGCGFKKRGLKTSIQISEYIDKLEAQIEKMKCCENCNFKLNKGCEGTIWLGKEYCDKWELAE